MQKLRYCAYVLYSLKDFKFYIGSTSNLEERLVQHDQGRSKSTAKRRPLLLIFCEFFLSKKDALRRERYFKTDAGKRALRLMLRESLREIMK